MRLVENEHQEDKKHPVQKTPFVMSCTLLHVIPVTALSGKHSVRKRENMNMGPVLFRAKHSLINQKNAFGNKSNQEKHRHNQQLYLL